MKKLMLLILVCGSYLGAMDNQPQTAAAMYAKAKELKAQSLAHISAVQEELKNPGLEPHATELLSENLQDYQKMHTKSHVIFAEAVPVCFFMAIVQLDQTTVHTILTDFPTVVWENSSGYSGSWVDLAIYYAAQVANNQARAHLYDKMAIYLFNQIKNVASATDNYGQALADLLQNKNPLLQACKHGRKSVVRALVPDINTAWRGSLDDQSPLQWAKKKKRLQQGFESNGIGTAISVEGQECAQSILGAFSHAQLQQSLANNQAMLAAKYQLPPELKAQAEQQAAQWQQMQARAAANQGLNTQSQTR